MISLSSQCRGWVIEQSKRITLISLTRLTNRRLVSLMKLAITKFTHPKTTKTFKLQRLNNNNSSREIYMAFRVCRPSEETLVRQSQAMEAVEGCLMRRTFRNHSSWLTTHRWALQIDLIFSNSSRTEEEQHSNRIWVLQVLDMVLILSNSSSSLIWVCHPMIMDSLTLNVQTSPLEVRLISTIGSIKITWAKKTMNWSSLCSYCPVKFLMVSKQR